MGQVHTPEHIYFQEVSIFNYPTCGFQMDIVKSWGLMDIDVSLIWLDLVCCYQTVRPEWIEGRISHDEASG